MTPSRRARVVFAFIAAVVAGSTIAPSQAGEPAGCNASKAAAFRAAGDRYNAQHEFTSAAGWYVAAAKQTRSCPTPDGSLLTARALAQAGTAFAQAGDYLQALPLLHESRSRLTSIEAQDRRIAPEAHAFAEVVDRVVSAVDRGAADSM